jgi:hypothetical protein
VRSRTPEQGWKAFNTTEDFRCGSASGFLIRTFLNERIIQFAGGGFAANDLINAIFENELQTALDYPDDIV